MSRAESQARQYATEIVYCDRCDGMGEVEDDLWVWVRCYQCGGRGTIEVCAVCLDEVTDERCYACGM